MRKFIAIFSILLVVCQADIYDDERTKMKQYHQECLGVGGVDEALVTKAETGDFTDDEKLKEHIFCVSKKMGFQNDEGVIDKQGIKANLMSFQYDESKADGLIRKCAIQKSTPQETAYEMAKCYYADTGLF